MEDFSDLRFPLCGIDISDAHDVQTAREVFSGSGVYSKTTFSALNVRGCETFLYRFRGGSRPGLVRRYSNIGPVLMLTTITTVTTPTSGPQA